MSMVMVLKKDMTRETETTNRVIRISMKGITIMIHGTGTSR